MTNEDFLRPLLLLTVLCCVATTGFAQQRLHVHTNAVGGQWDFPVTVDSITDFSVSSDRKQLLLHVSGEASVPFALSQVDSLTIGEDAGQETKDHHKVFQLYITTNDGRDITSRDSYKDCFINLNGQGSFSNYSANAQIRCRGNSSFLWYDKKPLRLKLNEKHKLLGLGKAKSWVLLANYRDVTDLMNTFVFETGEWLGLPFTNHTRYVELFVNGDYRGVYQLTEQVQQGKNRVDVSDGHGILITLDVDDGPGESPLADDNCWTKVYRMPMAVKYPDDERFTENTVDSVRTVFAELEQAIKDKDYARVQTLLDIPSFIKYLQLQEFIYNVELSAPRSIFLHKDGDGPWVMGPLWDFDAGYDFDWGNMYAGHDFFANYRETVMGTNPLKRNGNYNYVPQFFTDLFGCPEFVEQYKAHWDSVKDSIVSHGWNECTKYVEQLRGSGAMGREAARWPIQGKNFTSEVKKMQRWLEDRAEFLTDLIANIPMPDTTTVSGTRYCGSVQVPVTMQRRQGYDQDVKVNVSRDEVLSLMGIGEDQLKEANITMVPLNKDGSEGPNNTNGVFGAWFNGDGEPQDWGHGHVYIEVFTDLWNWSCGVHPDNCRDDGHTVTMQIQYPHEGTLLKVDVEVLFTIESGGWWW
ncbi:MAG: CotH kinase family protein [Prevotella sp.]|nr:CotH kinase family protein [Prevotella sp.]